MRSTDPTVFISYSHDSDAHKRIVREVAEFLTRRGAIVALDQFEHSPERGWAAWAADQIETADFVLMVCSPRYCELIAGGSTRGDEDEDERGKGTYWEAHLVQQWLYDQRARNERIFPVFFGSRRPDRLPSWLRGQRHLLLPDEQQRLLELLGIRTEPTPTPTETSTSNDDPATARPTTAPPESPERDDVRPAAREVTRARGRGWLITTAAVVVGGVLTGVALGSGAFGAGTTKPADSPILVDVVAPRSNPLPPGATVPLVLRISPDDVRDFEVAGRTLDIVDGLARYDARTPLTEGRLRLPWACSIDGVSRSGTLDLTVRHESRSPAGFERIDPRPTPSGYARTVRDPRTGIVFQLIETGTFTMGSDERSDEQPRLCRIEKPFYLARHETTVGQWRTFADEIGYDSLAESSGEGGLTLSQGTWRTRFDPQASWRTPTPHQTQEYGDRHPALHIAFVDALAFCEHYGYRLPTEVEWEYACRAGTETTYFWGDDPADGAGHGNFADRRLDPFTSTSGGFPFDDGAPFAAPVESYEPNPWELHDMLGNAWEWVDLGDPEATGGMVRGGSWGSPPRSARCANRVDNMKTARSDCIGFRVALDPDGAN